MNKLQLAVLLAASTLAACGTPECDPAVDAHCGPVHTDPAQCLGNEYTAFDATHHAPQDARLLAFKEMNDLMSAARTDPATAAAKFGAAKAKYEDAAHELRAKVQGRKDDHFADGHPRRSPGAAMDALIQEGLAHGAAATTAAEASQAKQKVEKTLIRFFYLSTFHELVLGDEEKLDEAFGYYGSKRANTVESSLGISNLLLKRDADNGTTLGADAYGALREASCTLATHLAAGGAAPLKLADSAAYKAAVEKMDARMQTGLAYSAARYFHSPDAARGDRFQKIAADPAKGEGLAFASLLEGEMYFNAVEPYLLEAGSGKKIAAEYVRAQIDAAKANHATGDKSWPSTIEDETIFDTLEQAFGIDVKVGG